MPPLHPILHRHPDIHDGHALVINIGGFTTDWIEVNPGGEVDYSIAKSVPVTQYHFLCILLFHRQ